VDGNYDNIFSKIALAVTSAQVAKSMSVTEHGVGEDLSFNFFVWNGGHLSAVAQLQREYMRIPPSDRLKQCGYICAAFRKFWGATDITMVAEGFCSFDKEKTQDLDLAKIFADNSVSGVHECISVSHASVIGGVPRVDLVAVPYVYQEGRRVEWLEMLIHPDGAQKVIREYTYPKMLMTVMEEEPVEDELPQEAYEEMIINMVKNGFYVQEM
jgi:hypothetical protein